MPLHISYVSKTETFNAAHRLHSPQLSDEENQQVYGKCNWPNGHGHNYKVEVTLRGPVDERTGMVLNLTELKQHMGPLLAELDHKNLDMDVEYFKAVPSTAENIAIYVWQQLCSRSSVIAALLYEVRIHETDKNVAFYRGEVE